MSEAISLKVTPLVERSTRKPVSFVEVSAHERLICAELIAVATRLVGAVGAGGSTPELTTLICGDGVHPSNPAKHADYSEAALDRNGYQLRNVLTLRVYADVVRGVLAAKR